MKIPPISLSLRARLLLGSALVQVAMLALLIASGIRVMDAQLAARAQVHLEEQKHLLAAAVEGHLRRGDLAAITATFERVRSPGDISYLVLFDAGGRPLAASGWDPARQLPRPDSALTDPAVLAKRR